MNNQLISLIRLFMATLHPHSDSVPFRTSIISTFSSPSKSLIIPSLPFKHTHHHHHKIIHNNHRYLTRPIHVSSPHNNYNTPDDRTTNSAPTAEKFDWYSHWYPLDPICELDKKAPRGRTVLGLDVVIWWDPVTAAWKVLDDRCPHRLAPLSEGRIDHRGRLQCVYHGWCFDGDGACKYIPQAPTLGPPVQKSQKACVAVYPSLVQNNILWFWPNTSSQCKDIMHKTRPPFIPELDDPSFAHVMMARDVSYGYEILAENLLDPAHIPYAHHGIMALRNREDPGRVESDSEGGTPMKLIIEKSDISGIDAGYFKFIAPCVTRFTLSKNSPEYTDRASWNAHKFIGILLCIPVNPGKSRIIAIATWNFAKLLSKFIPRWFCHVFANLILDSDLYLLHVGERKLASEGISNWQKAYYLPTQADAMVVAFRSWLRKYSNNKVNWMDKSDSSILPASPSREQLMDRYWSHVVHCKSCSRALRALKAIKLAMRVVSVALIGILAAAKNNPSTNISNVAKVTVVSVAIVSILVSHWLSQLIHTTFYYHDYNHATRANNVVWKILDALGNNIVSSF